MSKPRLHLEPIPGKYEVRYCPRCKMTWHTVVGKNICVTCRRPTELVSTEWTDGEEQLFAGRLAQAKADLAEAKAKWLADHPKPKRRKRARR